MFNKKLAITLAIFIAVMVSFSAYVMDIAANGESTTTVLPVISTKLVKIEGMTCESCEKALAGAAKKIKGVQSIQASAKDGVAIVKFDLVKTDIDDVMKGIRKTGYRPISYEDYDPKKVPETLQKIEQKESSMKCGAGKCGSK